MSNSETGITGADQLTINNLRGPKKIANLVTACPFRNIIPDTKRNHALVCLGWLYVALLILLSFLLLVSLHLLTLICWRGGVKLSLAILSAAIF